MPGATRSYNVGNRLLWGVLSTYEYLRTFTPLETSKPVVAKEWFSEADGLAMLALEEAAEAGHHEFLTRNQQMPIEEAMGALMSKDAETLQECSRKLHEKYRDIPEMSILYYAYLAWLRQTLVAFNAFMHEEILRASDYFVRYQENRSTFNHLIRLLDEEQQAEDIRQSLPEADRTAFWNEIEKQGIVLANEWKQAVVSVSNDIDYRI